MRKLAVSLVMCVGLFAWAPAANAGPIIGYFYYEDLGGGPTITVQNTSGSDFTEIVITLVTAGDPGATFGWGNTGGGTSFLDPSQPGFSFSPLPGPGSATLNLDPNDPLQEASLSLNQQGEVVDTNPITPNDPQTPIGGNNSNNLGVGQAPEPATLLLLTTGAAVVASRRRSAAR